jgi:hypothetical protein
MADNGLRSGRDSAHLQPKRRRAMNVWRLPTSRKIIAAAACGMLAAGMMLPAEAQAGRWKTYGQKGVYAEGYYSRKNGRSYLKGYVKDTRCDNRAAILDYRFGENGAFGPPRGGTVEAHGCGKVTRFDFNSQHRPIGLQECVTPQIIAGQNCGPVIEVLD